MKRMRIALVSPYSWTYPGGVTRHIEALAERFIEEGHQVRVLAPYDPPDTFAAVLHRGARPQTLTPPEYLYSLGRTVGFKANGAVSNLTISPHGVATLQKELRTGGYDVVHIHEPIAPLAGWIATGWARLPLVGTFHSYSENRFSNGVGNLFGARWMLNHLHVRIAVSEAAAWTGRRFFGGHYRVIPNGVHVDPDVLACAGHEHPGDTLRLLFVGQSVERKGLPLLLRSFEALREHIETELTVIGPTHEELAPLMVDDRDVRVLGKVDDQRKHEELRRADLLVAPSLHGESFGMVLTEAFAAGTPVVASDIAGYRDVVRNGVDGVLVTPGDAQALAETLRDISEEPERRREMARAAARDVETLCMAARRRAGDRGLRGCDRDPEAGRQSPAGCCRRRSALRRSEAARQGAEDPEPRAATRTQAVAAGDRRSPSCDGGRLDRGDRARGAGAQQDRAGPHRVGADQFKSHVRAAGPRRDVQRDGRPRPVLVRDPACLAPSDAGQARRRDAGDVHRRADVLDAALPAWESRRARWSSRGEPAGHGKTCRSCWGQSSRRRCSTSSRSQCWAR